MSSNGRLENVTDIYQMWYLDIWYMQVVIYGASGKIGAKVLETI